MSVSPVNASQQTFCYEVLADGTVPQQRTTEEVVATASELLIRASQERGLVAKRNAYNKAFADIREPYCPELRPLLFRLFERYAMETCYAQESSERDKNGRPVDDELGYRMCARLMELSFCMQIEDLGFHQCEYDWSQHTSLEALIQDLQIDPQQKGLFFDVIEQAQFDDGVLVRSAQEKGLREVITDTLCSLAFSYQNIAALSDGHYTLHTKVQGWTEALIGEETVEQKQRLSEYLFHRAPFMLVIQQASWSDKLEMYDLLKKLFDECYPPKHPELIIKQARINNLQGTIVARSGQKNADQIAEHYFKEAYTLCKSIPQNVFLLGSVLTGMISCLANRTLDQQSASTLYVCAKELREIIDSFQRERHLHWYDTDHVRSVQLAEQALKGYEEAQRP